MGRLWIAPAAETNKDSNVSLENAQAYYDKDASCFKRITLLKGSLLSADHGQDGWVPPNLEKLVELKYLEKVKGGYNVLKPICGSPGGTAASVLGRSGPTKPNGYALWKFANGRTIDEEGERP